MATPPDVRVRLSAEGVQEVVAALRTVQRNTQQASLRSGRSFDNLNGVLIRTRSLLASVGVAASVGGLVAAARGAAAFSDELEDAAQSIGTTQERLQGFSVTAQLNGVNVNQSRQAFAAFSRQLDDLANRSPRAIETFGRLGLSLEDFDGLDAAQALELVAKRLATLEDGITKSAIASDLFGARLGSRLIPTLNALARVGLDGTIERARELGLVFDDDVVASAARVNDEMDLMGKQAQGLAVAFTAGLSPAVHSTFLGMSESARETQDAMKEFGQITGFVLRFVILLLHGLGTTVQLVTGLVAGGFTTMVGTLHGLARGGFRGAVRAYLAGFKAIADQQAETIRRSNEFSDQLFTDVPAAGIATEGPPFARGSEAARRSVARQGLEILAASRDDELKLTELTNRLLLEAEKNRYQNGLISLQEYMDSRRAVVQTNLEAELRALGARRAVAAQGDDPQKALIETSKIDAEIQRERIEADAALTEINREQLDATEKLTEQRRQGEIDVLELQGRTHEARMQQIQAELEAEDRRLVQQGESEEEARRIANETAGVKQRALAAEEASAAVQAELAALALERAQIEQDIAIGAISELDGLRQILALEQSRLPILQQAVDLAVERARQTGNADAIAQADELAVAIRNIGVAASESQIRLANLRQETGDVLEPVVTDLLAAEIGAKSFGDALASAFLGAVSAVRRLASELLASRLFELLGFSFAGSGLSTAAGREASGLFAGPAFAEGGPVTGPGTGTSDSVIAKVSRGEFIVREAVARDPGIRAHLEQLNRHGAFYAPDWRMPAIRGFAEGGAVDGPGAPAGLSQPAGRIDGQLTIELGEGLVANQLESSSATARALIRVIGRERHAIRRLLRAP